MVLLGGDNPAASPATGPAVAAIATLRTVGVLALALAVIRVRRHDLSGADRRDDFRT